MFEIRNPKSEIRNNLKSKIHHPDKKARYINYKSLHRPFRCHVLYYLIGPGNAILLAVDR